MSRERTYHVFLTDVEKKLFKSEAKKVTSSIVRSRYLILLAADESKSKGKILGYDEIASRTGVTVPTVISTLKAFSEGGIESALAIKRNKNSDVARLKVDGELEARIIAKALSKAPKGRKRWTVSLLEEAFSAILQSDSSYEFDKIDRTTISRALKRNKLRPHLSEYWCIPPEEDAEFVACMEDVLEVYERPYDPTNPLWCMDEKPFQLLDDARQPLPMRPGDDQKIDSEYKRDGTVAIFCFIQPHTGTIHTFTEETRTAVDWAEKMKYLVDVIAPDVEKITLVMDNLNTHCIGSLYKAFPPEEARRIARKLEVHYTPKHGSWLDIAEIGIKIMTEECLGRRIPSIEALREELSCWETSHNEDPKPIDWQFTNEKARIKLRRLYPDIQKAREARDERVKAKREKAGKAETDDNASSDSASGSKDTSSTTVSG